ncbi:MAG: ankyrin repeat domain-containing protein [Victivallales bacterium]
MKLPILIFLAVFSLSCYSQSEYFNALNKNDLVKIKSIFDANPDLVNKEREFGTYPMFEAAEKFKIDVVKYLIEKGARTEVKTGKFGDNVILYMARVMPLSNGSIALLDLFAAQKANFSAVDKEGHGPLYLFAEKDMRPSSVKDYMSVVNAFIKNGSKITDRGNSCTLHKLLKSKGVRISDDKTEFGNFEAAMELVELGANVNEIDDAKNTPLHVVLMNRTAKDEDKADIVKFLVEKGARINVKNNAKQSPEDLVKKDSTLRDILKKTKPKK